MNPKDEAASIKIKNIIDMAITFTAMTRVFAKGSKPKIAAKLERSFGLLAGVAGQDDFEKIHAEFCEWFAKNISSSKKERHAASYGQAAKVFSIALKVYVYYCNLPDPETSARLLPWLHAGVDTKMMNYLKQHYPDAKIKAATIEAVGKLEYVALRKLVAKDIETNFENRILPVHYDDIMWYCFNRPTLHFVHQDNSLTASR